MMIKNIVRYLGLALVIIGVVLVMKNLFSTDTNDWGSKNLINGNSKNYYTANVKLLNEENDEYIVGASLVLKDENDKVIDEWKTTDKDHSIIKLEKGTYTLEQVETIDGFEKSEKVITFKIDSEDKNIVMYNSKKEEVKEISSEVNVESTASFKNSFTSIVASILVLIGIGTIIFPNKKLMIKER